MEKFIERTERVKINTNETGLEALKATLTEALESVKELKAKFPEKKVIFIYDIRVLTGEKNAQKSKRVLRKNHSNV